MSLEIEPLHIAAPLGVGSVTYNLVGSFTPLLVYPITSGQTSESTESNFLASFGASDDTTERSVVASGDDGRSTTITFRHHDTVCVILIDTVTGNVTEAGTVTGFAAGQVTINWTTVSGNATLYSLLAIGGSDVANVNVSGHNYPGGVGNASYNAGNIDCSAGDAAMIAFSIRNATAPADKANHNNMSFGLIAGDNGNMAMSIGSTNGVGTSDSSRYQRTDKAIVNISQAGVLQQEATWVQWEDGTTQSVTLNYTTSVSTQHFFLVTMQGARFAVINGDTPTVVGNKAYTGSTFKPKGSLVLSFGRALSASINLNAHLCMGFDDGVRAGSYTSVDQDGVGTSDNYRKTDLSNSLNIISTSAGVDRAYGRVQSFDPDGDTFNFPVVDAVALEFLQLVVGDAPGTIIKDAIENNYPLTLGQVGAPVPAQHPNPASMVAALRGGYTWAEALLLGMPVFNSQWRAIGDPLAVLPLPLQGYNVYKRLAPGLADTLVAIAPKGTTTVDLTGFTDDSLQFLRVTTVSKCGVESQDAVVLKRAAFDSSGNLIAAVPNAPRAVGLSPASGGGGAVTARWQYFAGGHAVAPSIFNVYVAQDAAAFNFGSPTATVTYANQHKFTSALGTFSHGTLVRVIVRSQSAAGDEEANVAEFQHRVDALAPDNPSTLDVEVVAQ